MKTNNNDYNTFNNTLLYLLNTEFGHVRQVTVKGVVYYLAHDVCKVLGLTNTTTVINGLSDTTVQNGPMKTNIKMFIESVNKHRKVYLISIEGVFEIILKGKSSQCTDIKEYFAHRMLPKCAGLMGA